MRENLKFILFLVFVSLLFCGIFFLINRESKTYKYKIIDYKGIEYKTLDYEKVGDCIKFISNKTKIEICGSYQIKENNNYSNQ